MKRLFCLCVLILTVSLCFSASLTILVNQRDASGKVIFENTRIYEDGLINYFFEAGTIVSNEPVCLDSEYKGSYQAALDASKSGYIEYLVVFTLSANADTQELSHVDWKIIQVWSGNIIEEGSIKAPVITDKKDIERGILKFAEQNGVLVLKAIAKRR